MRIEVLDSGYVELVEHWGSDQRIIEAARMSTNKGFLGWGDEEKPGDEKLLAYLYNHKHHTPFEMAGAIFEIEAPIMVFREWHRHRTQSYNEMSARYVPIPDENYVPSTERILQVNELTANKQAAGSSQKHLSTSDAIAWRHDLRDLYAHAERLYQQGLNMGIAKELARLSLPVGRYSRMRASANLRNWLGFLSLRMAPNAQWEIREYAEAVHTLLSEHFNKTMSLFDNGGKS